MSDSCPICGNGYYYGPSAVSHARCQEVRESRHRVDKAVEWIMSDDPEKGPAPELVERLRAELNKET